MLALCATSITACRELEKYGPEGLRVMRRTLAAYLPTLEHLAQQLLPWAPSAARLAAQGYLLVSILADYYRRLEQMEAACRMARLYAKLAQDLNLKAMALNRLAVKFDYERRDYASLETYQKVLALPGFATLTPLVQSRVYVGLAAPHAYCQQKPQALSFLSQASERYPEAPEADPHYSLPRSTPGSFAVWTGLVLKHTGQYARAAETFARFGKPGVAGGPSGGEPQRTRRGLWPAVRHSARRSRLTTRVRPAHSVSRPGMGMPVPSISQQGVRSSYGK
jgi:tetratricopeptide (TPR) repeat protein